MSGQRSPQALASLQARARPDGACLGPYALHPIPRPTLNTTPAHSAGWLLGQRAPPFRTSSISPLRTCHPAPSTRPTPGRRLAEANLQGIVRDVAAMFEQQGRRAVGDAVASQILTVRARLPAWGSGGT